MAGEFGLRWFTSRGDGFYSQPKRRTEDLVDKNEIRAIRKKLHMTQEQFSRSLNVSWVTVNRWEAGKNEPKPETVDKLLELSKMEGK